ncbi:MAG: sporulation protein YtfJ, partial [Clostridia bacterium]|nr:sporulation protein YtfJ [Clostridia bacterium]
MNSNINQMLDSLMKNIDVISETKKVIGDVISMDDGTIIVPVSKVSMGFGGGGSDF